MCPVLNVCGSRVQNGPCQAKDPAWTPGRLLRVPDPRTHRTGSGAARGHGRKHHAGFDGPVTLSSTWQTILALREGRGDAWPHVTLRGGRVQQVKTGQK